MAYKPVVIFRAKCFAKSPLEAIYGKHWVASWEDKVYQREANAISFARKQIDYDLDVWQLAGAKRTG